MPGNRRRHANAVPLLSMAAWIVVCLFVGAAGLGYVAIKSQLHASGREIEELEKERDELQVRNRVARATIAELSSLKELDKRFKSDKTHLNGLIEIPWGKPVFVDRPRQGPVDNDSGLHQVANRETTHP